MHTNQVPKADVSAEPALPKKPVLEWNSGDIDRVYRSVRDSAEPEAFRVSWLGNHTMEPVARAAVAFARAWDLHSNVNIGPFDRHYQEILDDASGTSKFEPELIVLWLSLRRLSPALVEGCRPEELQNTAAEIARIQSHIRDWVAAAKAKTSAHLLICNFPRPPKARFSVADTSMNAGEFAGYAQLNGWLVEEFSSDPNVSVLDIAHAVGRAGSERSWNPKMYRLAKIEWDGPAVKYVAESFARFFRAFTSPAKKCVVLDLDNTLWGGVVGEDGVEGVRVGEGDAVAESFTAFQRSLLDLKASGILLAVCSKNNAADVEQMFEATPHMPLRRQDFAAVRINWQPKNRNIEEIANELNIGLDSLVFVDDNPAECELIRQMVPEVEVVHLPEDPSTYADLLRDLPYWDKLSISDEDRRKTEQYIENRERETSRSSAQDLSSFLESLETRIEIKPASEQSVSRVHQLFTKTNQFNVTTIRYSLPQIQEMVNSENCLLETVRASDKFGDLGIIGIYLIRLGEGGHAEIDSFVLSCRALGRQIETAICNTIKKKIFTDMGFSTISAEFVPTAKNKPAERFFDDQGFLVCEERKDGSRKYRLSRADSELISCPGISITTEKSE